MVRKAPSALQDFLSSVVLPCLSLTLLPTSLLAVLACVLKGTSHKSPQRVRSPRCVLISGGRMSKGLALARSFKRAGWVVIGVEEEGWGECCPMRFSHAVDKFYLLPPASLSYARYSERLIEIAIIHSVNLFIPVSGAGSSVEDARAAEIMSQATNGQCQTFIQDTETMLDLHEKDRFMDTVKRLGMRIPSGRMVNSVEDAIGFLRDTAGPTYVLKCMGLDENRGDMTLWPLNDDDGKLSNTRRALNELRIPMSQECPYVFQEYIPGQEWCTHASVVKGHVTSFVACPSNDMLMTYEDGTTTEVGRRAEEWTTRFLGRLQADLTIAGDKRRLTGHFSFDFIMSLRNDELYPIECNARVHTAIILLPLSQIAGCYSTQAGHDILRPLVGVRPRSWVYNDIVMRYLPFFIRFRRILGLIHPSLPACSPDLCQHAQPSESPFSLRVDPTLVAEDWLPFLVLWHVWWPYMLVTRWWQGKKWTRLNVSTGRIFEA